MRKINVLTVIGTRPEVIKMAPVIRALEEHPSFASILCNTGQHLELFDQADQVFQLKQDFNLRLMKPGQSLLQLGARMLLALEQVIKEVKPDWILAQGDTSSVWGAATAAFYEKIPFGHVEAGLRSYDLQHPFPEEGHRKMVDSITQLLFVPTREAKQNLLDEGIDEALIRVTGNTVLDALRLTQDIPFDLEQSVISNIPFSRRIILVTAHRRENHGQALSNICASLRQIASRYPKDVQIVFPVHMNPKVRTLVITELSDVPNISLLPPLDYPCFIQLMRRSYLVLTDSGGLQEEAPFFDKPVLVMRKTTERPEGVQAGVSRLVGLEKEQITAEVCSLLEDKREYRRMARSANPYGDGYAAERILHEILQFKEKYSLVS